MSTGQAEQSSTCQASHRSDIFLPSTAQSIIVSSFMVTHLMQGDDNETPGCANLHTLHPPSTMWFTISIDSNSPKGVTIQCQTDGKQETSVALTDVDISESVIVWIFISIMSFGAAYHDFHSAYLSRTSSDTQDARFPASGSGVCSPVQTDESYYTYTTYETVCLSLE